MLILINTLIWRMGGTRVPTMMIIGVIIMVIVMIIYIMMVLTRLGANM
jgi:hypothetical protein